MVDPRISTYYEVTEQGAVNPFTNIPNVTAYGNTATDYHEYLLAFNREMPVFNDITRVTSQILRVFTMHRAEWALFMQSYPEPGENLPLNRIVSLTESITHSGTDTSSTGGTATDKENTYDTATLKETRETTSSGSGSTVHGHKIDTVKQRWTGDSPAAGMSMVIDVSKKQRLFENIINAVIDGISCRIYLPENPSND